MNQVVGEPGGVARGASTAQLARSGRRTQDEEAQRDTSDRPALWLPWAIDVVAFRVFFSISDLSMFFIIAKKKSNQNSQGLEVKGGATRQGRPFDTLVSSGNVPFSLILDQ